MRKKWILRRLGWFAIAAVVILVARAVAYALNQSPTAELLQHRAGGPALPVVTLVVLVCGGSAAVAITFLAWLGVRERALLERSATPRLRLGRMLARSAVLWFATVTAGGLLEAYVHWRAGLGWHGIHCVVGPVHRDLLPIDGALSLVAAALATAVEHVVAWMRRTFARLTAPPAYVAEPPASVPVFARTFAGVRGMGAGGPRAPPAFS